VQRPIGTVFSYFPYSQPYLNSDLVSLIFIIIIIIIMLTFIMRLLLQNKNIGAVQKYK